MTEEDPKQKQNQTTEPKVMESALEAFENKQKRDSNNETQKRGI